MPEPHTPAVDGSHEPGTIPANPPSQVDWTKLDALLEELPPGIPILPPEDAGNFAKYTHSPPHVYAPGDGWKNCARALEGYDAELCKGYREEIDTLLVFAGLFSAVVTAFTIESYQWLQADPNDAMIVLLSQIAQSISPNNTVAPPVPTTTGLPGSVSVRINVYWFLALALSLSAALIAILCKQWIREFERNMGISPQDFVGIHQTRVEGLEKWRVGAIISLLPLLLQLALAIFALGILDLLWRLHSTVAALVFVPTAVAFIFYAGTTFLPALLSYTLTFPECPYKSPQAILAFPICQLCIWMRDTFSSGLSFITYVFSLSLYHLASGFGAQRGVPSPIFHGKFRQLELHIPGWRVSSLTFNRCSDMWRNPQYRPSSRYRSLRWMLRNLDDGDLREWIWLSLWESAMNPNPNESIFQHIQGFHHVECGLYTGPIGLRGIALAYLSQTPAPRPFVVEAYVQNLSAVDFVTAEDLIRQLCSRIFSVDSTEAVIILRAACAYARLHVQDPIGNIIRSLIDLALRISDLELRRRSLGCMLVFYGTWIGAQPMPLGIKMISMTMQSVESFLVSLFLYDREDSSANPDRLRRLPGVQDLAQLVYLCEESNKAHEALFARTVRHTEDDVDPVYRELLDIARYGISQGDSAAPAAPDGGPPALHTSSSSPPDAPSPAAPGLSGMARSPEDVGARSSTRRPSGRTPATQTQTRAPASHGPAVEDSIAHVRSLDMGRHGIERGDGETPFAAASERALSLPRPPAALAWSSTAQPPALWVGDGPHTLTPHDTASCPMLRAQPVGHLGSSHAVEDSGGQDGLPRSAAGPPDSPTLRSTVIHAPDRAQTPLGDDEARPRTGGQESEDGGGTDVRQSAVTGPAREDVPLQAVVIGEHVQTPSGGDDEVYPRADGGYGHA